MYQRTDRQTLMKRCVDASKMGIGYMAIRNSVLIIISDNLCLQVGIDAVMPDNLAKYKAECDKAAEAKGAGVAGIAASTAVNAPRKKFLWRREMRENFFAIVKEKLKQFFESPEGWLVCLISLFDLVRCVKFLSFPVLPWVLPVR